MIIYDGCDAAIVGFMDGESEDLGRRVVYDYVKLIEVFQAQGMEEDDAVEWVSFNILGAYLGRQTPAILFPGDRAMIDMVAEDEPEEDTK